MVLSSSFRGCLILRVNRKRGLWAANRPVWNGADEACGRGAQGWSQKRFWNFRYQANRLYCISQASGLMGGRKGTKQRQVSYSALSTVWGTLADEGAFGRGDALGLGVGEEATLDPWRRAPDPLLPATPRRLSQPGGMCRAQPGQRQSSVGRTEFKASEPERGRRRPVSLTLLPTNWKCAGRQVT